LLIAPLVAPTVTLLLALSFSQSADLFVQQLTDPTIFQVFQTALLRAFSSKKQDAIEDFVVILQKST
jgi:hypothetical protein